MMLFAVFSHLKPRKDQNHHVFFSEKTRISSLCKYVQNNNILHIYIYSYDNQIFSCTIVFFVSQCIVSLSLILVLIALPFLCKSKEIGLLFFFLLLYLFSLKLYLVRMLAVRLTSSSSSSFFIQEKKINNKNNRIEFSLDFFFS